MPHGRYFLPWGVMQLARIIFRLGVGDLDAFIVR